MKSAKPALAGLLLLMLAACLPTDVDERADLTHNMLRWNSRRPDTYEIVLERSRCECLPEMIIPVRVAVHDGELVSVYDVEGDTVLAEPPYHAMPVSELFTIIMDAIERDAYRVSITYDPEFGYPRHIYIKDERDGADDETAISARDFRAVASTNLH